jgi:hypothetical protein
VPGTAGEDFTKEAARQSAGARVAEMREKERAHRKPLERVAKWSKEDSFEPIVSSTDFVGNGDQGGSVGIGAREGVKQFASGAWFAVPVSEGRDTVRVC